jgi:citrate lyase subunit beta / citryl-CoA lyase
MRALRSLLNTPANRPGLVEKAFGYEADAVILDLEDSVPLDQKDEARAIAHDAIAAQPGATLFVRVNGLASGLIEDDLAAVTDAGLEGIQLPKVDDADTIRAVDCLLADLERERHLPIGGIELLVSLESARGVFAAHQILTAADRVGSVMIGTAENGDLHGDIGYVITPGEEETLYLRSRVLLAARVAGITNPIDGVYADYRNLEGLEATSRRARALGYRGKKVIHPAQVPIVNRIFSPTAAELDFHRRVLEEFDAALARGVATAVVDGRMIDYAMAETARRVLARADDQPPPTTEGGA